VPQKDPWGPELDAAASSRPVRWPRQRPAWRQDGLPAGGHIWTTWRGHTL